MIYKLGDNDFKTKAKIKTYFQNFYRTHTVGTLLPQEQRRVMIDLIKWHPDYDTWDVNDDVQFKIGKDEYGTKNFWVLKTSGDWEVFSYNTCIASQTKEKHKRKNVIASARHAIKEQINSFRDSNPECVKCGSTKNIEIDHNFETLTFQTMLDNFLEAEKKNYSDFQLVSTPSGHRFNVCDKKTWEEYHRSNCQLRSLCFDCHRLKKNK